MMHYERDMENSEVMRAEFRRPRDILLSLVSDFFSKCSARLADVPKKSGYDGKTFDILDIRSHLVGIEIPVSMKDSIYYCFLATG